MNHNYVPLGDPNILLSWVNTKLRDECKDLEQLCERYEVSEQIIVDKLKGIGYMYKNNTNQFIAQDSVVE